MAITKIGTPELFDFSATNTALQLPTGDTASRPAAPSTGEWRFNTTDKYVEYWDGGAWRQIDTESAATLTPSQNFNTNTYFGTGAAQAIDAKFNEAANFNGSSSYIAINEISPVSISMWVNLDTLDRYDALIGHSSNTSNYIYWADSSESYQLRLGNLLFGSGTAKNTVGVVGSFVNVVFVDNGSGTVTCYIDGSSAGSVSGSLSSYNEIGARTAGSAQYLKGKIDQVRIFNTALPATGTASVDTLYNDETTTTAATLNFPAGAGCIAAYQLDGNASDVGGTYGGVETNIGYTGLEFEPDFVWIKQRNDIEAHFLMDSIRGSTNTLYSNDVYGEIAEPQGVTSFDSNGFTLGSYGGMNGLNDTYAAWCWKAGGATTATNSAGAGNVPTAGSVKIDGANLTTALAGTIAATNISANTAAGFSIVKWTTSTQLDTVGHGLDYAPELIIGKGINWSSSWPVYALPVGNDKKMSLNDSIAAHTSTIWGDTTPTATTFKQDFTGTANRTSIAYCFHSVDGYQRVGSYTGTGNNPGPIVYTTNDGTATGTDGFEPAMIIIKRTDSAEDWKIIDNKRGFVNSLEPNETIAEQANNNSGFIAARNGFQINDTSGDYNANGGTYIYLAIAADKDTSVPTLANSFSTATYTGTGAAQSIDTPFAPDLSWIKSRSNSTNHELNDSVRGQVSRLSSDTTGGASDVANGFLSLDPNSFSLNGAGSGGEVNTSGRTYVSWNWKAGGLPTINNVTGSTITSVVSANQAAGFSIVKFTGNGTSGATIGHGLNVVPDMIIAKSLGGGTNWCTQIPSVIGNGNSLFLNTNVATQNHGSGQSDRWTTTPPTTSVFSIGGSTELNNSGIGVIAYCFHSVAGYQKIGSYIGNRPSTKTVYTTDDGLVGGTNGFRPRFLMIKDSSTPGENWIIVDSQREGASAPTKVLYPDTNGLEDPYTVITFTSNGFTVGNTGLANTNGATIIYLAIA